MAYPALISLKSTIECLLIDTRRISVIQQILKSVYTTVDSLQQVLKRLDSSSSSRVRVNAVDRKIREAAHKLEDLLESHEFDDHLIISREITSFTEAVKQMKEEYIKELDNPSSPEEDEEEGVAPSSENDFGGNKSSSNKSFGISRDEIRQIKDELTASRSYEFRVVSIVGMAGTGTSILARSVFEDEDEDARVHFKRLAWVTIGPNYQLKEILLSILAQIVVDPDGGSSDDELLIPEGDDEIAELLYATLKDETYMIVLDNVCDTQVWESLRRLFPDQNNGSRVLLTTSLEEVALFANSFSIHRVGVLNREESWDLFCKCMFNKELCPPELEKVGKKIVENCEGLRIEIIKAAIFLSQAEKTPEQWKEVAAAKQNSVSKETRYDEMSELPKISEELKSCNLFPHFVLSRFVSAMRIVNIIGLSTESIPIKEDVFPDTSDWKLKMVSLFGMAGIGKTTLAWTIFEDPLILHHFNHRVWLKLGPRYRLENMLVDILAQIDPNIDKMRMEGDHEILTEHLCTLLSGKRCLIVLDNVWNKEPLHSLKNFVRRIKFEVLVTTRLKYVAKFSIFDRAHEIHLLDKEESWYLLREKVFAKELCSLELDNAGKMIAENCEGLPLMIVTVASLLSKAEKSPQFWNKVAKKENLVFQHAYDEILKVLYSSFEYLPQHLKACFLYIGVFPQNYEIPTSRLFKLWTSERSIVEPKCWVSLKTIAVQYLEELDSRTLLIVGKRNYCLEIKTCRLHSAFWHLCLREARNNKFFHVLNSRADCLKEYMRNQRRLCIQNSSLFGIKTVHNSIASSSTIRSLLCTGPPHQYPVPMSFSLRLLKVLDALTIRFYEFPLKILELVRLRHLALTYNGQLPASISMLRNLQVLIVGGHLDTKLYGAPSYLPMEIWDMQELEHLQVMGSNLPDLCDVFLLNLEILLDVSAHTCTKVVLHGMPNLKKLGLRIELRPDASEPPSPFDYIFLLRRLKSLKCVIVNPELRSEIIAPPAPPSMLPSGLKKLSLSGFGYRWEYMRTIALLPNLEVLKLQCFAFQGPEWVMHSGEFKELKYLLLEDTDLVYWRADDECHLILKCLVIRHCYKLEEIPWESLSRSCKIELVDCNPSVSNKIPHGQKSAQVQSSWGIKR